MQTITIIGAGNVGTTLGILFRRQGHAILDIHSRTKASAERARDLIGAGRVADITDLAPADIIMVTTTDNALASVAEALAASSAVRKGTVVFHCSGPTPSSVFSALREKGALVAAVHPVKTFTDPAKDSETFAGAWCGAEGDDAALAVLTPLFEKAGAHMLPVDPAKKTLYHTAIVFLCNYLFPVIEAGMQCYEEAGVDRKTAAQVAAPILHATIDNALRLGPGNAITGPIARGDDTVVTNQMRALTAWKPELAALYATLGLASTELALQKGVAAPDKIALIRDILKGAA